MNAMYSMTASSAAIAESDPFASAVAPGAAAFDGAVPDVLDDPSAALLRTIAEVLDIRRVFPRVSAVVKPVVPHDALELVFRDRDGHVTLEATSGDDLPADAGSAWALDEAFSIVRDLRWARRRLAGSDASNAVDPLLTAGYRSMLTVRTIAHNQVMRLDFFSKRADAYHLEDVPTARHVADCIAVAVAHEQLAAAERDRAEARARAERVDARVRAVADRGEVISARGRMIGRSDAWQRVLAKAVRVASTEATVFLQGESGTGKEVVARFIHHASPRKDGPFVAINCAALPEYLLESELFGYERGAFTGAQQAKAGQIELAARGVLFLDEVSEMSPAAQAKFLRFLQEREFQRLGGTRTQRANVRVIAASNRDLRQAVEQGRFRDDLFYRLQVFDILLPPLRERLDDVPFLAEQFLGELGETMSRPPARLDDEAREALLAYTWPGNVRELRNVLERAAILTDDGVIERRHLSLQSTQGSQRAPVESSTDLSSIERQTIEAVLRQSDWNKSKAARRLGLTRTQLYVRLRRYGLEHSEAM
jgi:transcriptional regulator with GAF, ATPase, and Fis domain